MTYELIRYERVGAAGLITLNRPDQLNAYTPSMRLEMQAAMDEAEADDAVRAVIFTGAGRSFCAGADLNSSEISAPKTLAPDALPGEGELVMKIYNLAKPVIAAINGHAVGAGAALTLPMDIRLASTNAKIGFTFTRLGFAPEMASAWFLPRLVGTSLAMEWLATGRVLTTAEAVAGGLVKEVLEPDALLPRAFELAQEIALASPLSVAVSRRMVQRFQALDNPEAALRLDGKIVRARVSGGDAREAMAARSAKRLAAFVDPVSQAELAKFNFG
jgi:enoyl-CoA hydratase/carnithine racemase